MCKLKTVFADWQKNGRFEKMNGFKKYGFRVFRWLVAIFCFVYLIYKLTIPGSGTAEAVDEIFSHGNLLLLLAVILIMPLNWGIEALKWKAGAAVLQRISFGNALASVLAGVAVSMAGPNRTGEFLGRITALTKERRISGSFISIHISFAQTVVTILAGFLALLLLDPVILPLTINRGFLYVAFICISVFAVVIYYRFTIFYRLLKSPPLSRWFAAGEDSEVIIGNRLLSYNFALSLFRYILFSLQFVLIMKWCEIELAFFDLYIATAVIYLFMAVMPSFTLAELGIRGTVSVFVMGWFAVPSAPVILAASVIWIINLAIPAAVGAVILAAKK